MQLTDDGILYDVAFDHYNLMATEVEGDDWTYYKSQLYDARNDIVYDCEDFVGTLSKPLGYSSLHSALMAAKQLMDAFVAEDADGSQASETEVE